MQEAPHRFRHFSRPKLKHYRFPGIRPEISTISQKAMLQSAGGALAGQNFATCFDPPPLDGSAPSSRWPNLPIPPPPARPPDRMGLEFEITNPFEQVERKRGFFFFFLISFHISFFLCILSPPVPSPIRCEMGHFNWLLLSSTRAPTKKRKRGKKNHRLQRERSTQIQQSLSTEMWLSSGSVTSNVIHLLLHRRSSFS